MWFTLPEMGLAGMARVLSVGPCPPIEDGPGRVVLSTVTHYNSFVLRIWLEGTTEPLEPTKRHRLYSEERGGWVPAGKLEVGDRLRTLDGSTEILRIELKPGTHRVYNLEVETEHCYFVSDARVLNHNENPCAVGDFWDKLPFDAITRHGDPGEWRQIGNKTGFPRTAHDGVSTKHIEIFKDEYGDLFEVHYIRKADGTPIDVKDMQFSP